MMTRAIAGILLTLALAGPMAGPGQATEVPGRGLPSFVDTPCIGDFSGLPNEVQCRLLIVPETRGLENGRTVVMPVVVVRGIGPQRKPDPVIVLHGGPGGGEVEGLAGSLSRHPGLVGDGRDWIFFDQRGTGLAVPTLDCGVVGLSDAGLTDDFAVAAARACGQRHAAAGVDLSQYNIAAIVADLADLRRALGIDAYNLLGTSYGSRVAMGVMQRDARGLRAAVLDSLWPPEASWTGPLPPLVSRETRKVLALCAQDELCSARHPDLERRFDALLAGWLKAPRLVGTRRYTADDVAAFLLESLYDNDGARRLPASIARLLGDDLSELDQFLQEQSGYVEGLFLANLCKEEFPFESADAIEGLKGDDPIAVATARASARIFAACDGFPVGRPDPLDSQPVVSPLPTLILAAGIDAGCPVELAEAAVQRLAKGQLAIFPNTTHGVRWKSQCAQGIVSRFLDEPRSPIDTACIAVEHARFEFRLDD